MTVYEGSPKQLMKLINSSPRPLQARIVKNGTWHPIKVNYCDGESFFGEDGQVVGQVGSPFGFMGHLTILNQGEY